MISNKDDKLINWYCKRCN